jgi:hypothetical protein
MDLREWPPGIEFENLSLDQFKLEDAASALKIRLVDFRLIATPGALSERARISGYDCKHGPNVKS